MSLGLGKKVFLFVLPLAAAITLLFAFQNCTRIKVQDDTLGNSYSSVCKDGDSRVCTSKNGSGTQVCQAGLRTWSDCKIDLCQDGFNLTAGTCVSQPCRAGSPPVSCPTQNGIGERNCKSDSSGYGDCQAQKCDPGFSPISGVCVFTGCTAGQESDCTVYSASNVVIGVGKAVCKSDQSGFGTCAAKNCLSGYNLQGTQCISNVCNPGASESCGAIANGSNNRVCNSTGTAWGQCSIQCLPNFQPSGNSCTPISNVSCTPNTATGPDCGVANAAQAKLLCNALGNGYTPSCKVISCQNDFQQVGDTCACTPGALKPAASCSISNGTGQLACNSGGTGYTDCKLVNCTAPYQPNGNSCQLPPAKITFDKVSPEDSGNEVAYVTIFAEYIGTNGPGDYTFSVSGANCQQKCPSQGSFCWNNAAPGAANQWIRQLNIGIDTAGKTAPFTCNITVNGRISQTIQATVVPTP